MKEGFLHQPDGWSSVRLLGFTCFLYQEVFSECIGNVLWFGRPIKDGMRANAINSSNGFCSLKDEGGLTRLRD